MGRQIAGLFGKLVKLAAVLRVSKWRQALLRYRVAAAVEHAVVLRDLGDCRTVVDIGANRGQFALMAWQRFPKARIVSFEPLPRPVASFRATFSSEARVSLHEAAIGTDAGEAIIHVSKRDDSSSLLPITATQNATFPGTAEASTATIRVGPLREFVTEEQIEAPALLKLDVQGFELQALQGCESLLHLFAHVYVECSFVELYAGQALADEVIAWLRNRGFKLRALYNPAQDKGGRVVQADFLFARES